MERDMNSFNDGSNSADEDHFLQELGYSIQLSLAAVTSEPLPKEIGLLLLKVALAELAQIVLEEEAYETASRALFIAENTTAQYPSMASAAT